MPKEVNKISKFKELNEIKKVLEKAIETIDRKLNSDKRFKSQVQFLLTRDDLKKKYKKNHKRLIQIAKHIKGEITDDDDDDMPNASDDNISQEDTDESNESNDWNGFNASSAVSEQASDQSSMADHEQNHADTLEEMIEDYEAPGTSSNKATVPRRSPAKKPSLLNMNRPAEREASKRAREAIKKLFKNILQRTRNLKAESTEDDESSDWRQGQFAWIKFTERSKNLPGFVLPAMHGIRKAKTITLKGVLSLYKFVIYRSDPRIDDSLKDERYKRALADFNSRNDCKFR